MAKTKTGRSRSLSRPRNSTSRRNSNPEDGQGNIENGLYVHSSPPKVVSSSQGGSGSAHIREYLRGGNIAGLEEVVLEGQGPKLLTQSSTDPKVRAFLKTLPSFMSKIDLVHDAAERGDLRDLKTLLDRRKIARSRDSQGMGLMHKAVLSGNTEMVDYLMDNFPETAATIDNERLRDAGGGGRLGQQSLEAAAGAMPESATLAPNADSLVNDGAVAEENISARALQNPNLGSVLNSDSGGNLSGNTLTSEGKHGNTFEIPSTGSLLSESAAGNDTKSTLIGEGINGNSLRNPGRESFLSDGNDTGNIVGSQSIYGDVLQGIHSNPVGIQLKNFNEQLRSDLSFTADAETSSRDGSLMDSKSSDPFDGLVDWDADKPSNPLSSLFDESNVIKEENVNELSDDDLEKCPLSDSLSSDKQRMMETHHITNEQSSTSCTPFESVDLSSSIMSFMKKMPLPPTASGTRTSHDRAVVDEIFKSPLPRRKLSPVHNPRMTNINGTTYEIASPTLVKKLQPLDPKVIADQNAATGAIRKKPSAKKASRSARLKSVEDFKLPEKFNKTSTKPSPRHVAQVSYPVLPSSANIRDLVQRRNKIVFDFIRREARRSSLREENDPPLQPGPKSGTVKLPILVNETESAPEVVDRPRTPTVMPRSARERISVSKLKIDGRTVAAMKFKEGAFKAPMRQRQPKKLAVPPTVNAPKPSRVNEKPKRKISNLKKTVQALPRIPAASLGNLVYDGTKKRYPKDKNVGLELKGCTEAVENQDANESEKSEPLDQPNRINFNDELPPDLERFCRRLLWSIMAAAQAELGKIFKREIHNELAAEETKQVADEHDVSYWASNISDRVLDGVISTTKTTPPSRLKNRRPLKRLSLNDSGIHSGNRSASTQTSNTSTPKRVIKETNMAEIIAKLEELNVKLESGKPRYRHLVDQELDQQSKLKAFQEHWSKRKSSGERK